MGDFNVLNSEPNQSHSKGKKRQHNTTLSTQQHDQNAPNNSYLRRRTEEEESDTLQPEVASFSPIRDHFATQQQQGQIEMPSWQLHEYGNYQPRQDTWGFQHQIPHQNQEYTTPSSEVWQASRLSSTTWAAPEQARIPLYRTQSMMASIPTSGSSDFSHNNFSAFQQSEAYPTFSHGSIAGSWPPNNHVWAQEMQRQEAVQRIQRSLQHHGTFAGPHANAVNQRMFHLAVANGGTSFSSSNHSNTQFDHNTLNFQDINSIPSQESASLRHHQEVRSLAHAAAVDNPHMRNEPPQEPTHHVDQRALLQFRIGGDHQRSSAHGPLNDWTCKPRSISQQYQANDQQRQQQSEEGQFIAPLALPEDRDKLTVYQLLLRQSLEYFSATQSDVEARVRGRKQKIRLGQIGVRCRYCAHLQVRHRGKGAVYYPKSLINVYQAAQNIAGAHLSADDYSCPFVPIQVMEEIDVQKPRRDASKAGRAYWIAACKTMGIVERDGGLWINEASKGKEELVEEEADPGPSVSAAA